MSAVRLFAEVREAGYPGGYDLVKRYAREVRPRPAPEPAMRFETAPGRLGQVDFAEFGLPWEKRYSTDQRVAVPVGNMSAMLTMGWRTPGPTSSMSMSASGFNVKGPGESSGSGSIEMTAT